MSDNRAKDASAIPHNHEVGDTLEKVDTSVWKITNRLVDVDTDEVLYRLREDDVGPMNFTEMLTEDQVSRGFDVGDEHAE